MLLANFLKRLIKKRGFVLEDAHGEEHIIGDKEYAEKIKLKILNKDLHYKLLLDPDLYFGEAYTQGEIYFKKGDLTSFLDIAFLKSRLVSPLFSIILFIKLL